MWCPARVVRIADGENDKGRDGELLSSKARKLAPRGMVLLEWDADPTRDEVATTVWYLLDPTKWNGDGHKAWRYHPEQLAAIQKMQAVKRKAADAV